MEPHRSSSSDNQHGWFEGGEWDRGRHGAPDQGGSYRGAEGDHTGDVFGAHGYADPVPAPTSSAPDREPDVSGRRTTEAIDVGALRRPPVSTSPAEYPPPPAEYPPPPAYPPPAAYSQAERPLYPANPSASDHASPNPLSAPTASVPTVPSPGRSPSLYRSRNPTVMIVLAVLAVLFEVPALRLLGSAVVADNVPANGIVSGTFLVLGIPVFAYGLYGMLGGVVPSNLSGWLRQPLVYVPLGVLLFLFAALAA